MSQTADRYAKALFELAKEENNLEAVEGTMTDLKGIIAGSNDFRQFLSNPLLTCEECSTVLKALFEGKIPALSLRFLLFITYKSRLNILNDIIGSFDHLYLIATRQIRAYVTTAMPLEKGDRVLINQRLHEKFQCNMLTRWDTDPALIGGFRIFAQGKIYDYSFKNQLDHFIQQATQPS
jgi:F-type H+-transporting ATPase subunit delta